MRERFGMLTGVERAGRRTATSSPSTSRPRSNGEVLEDGSTTGMSYEVGSGKLMEGLDDAVRGLSADESTTFQTALLSGPNAGEQADVTVTVRSVKAKELPGAGRRVRLRPPASSTPWPSCATTSAPGWPAPRPCSRARRPATSWSST